MTIIAKPVQPHSHNPYFFLYQMETMWTPFQNKNHFTDIFISILKVNTLENILLYSGYFDSGKMVSLHWKWLLNVEILAPGYCCNMPLTLNFGWCGSNSNVLFSNNCNERYFGYFQIVLSWIQRDSIHTQCRSRIYAGPKDCRMVTSSHDKAFRITGPLWGESWSVDSSHKPSGADIWCFL